MSIKSAIKAILFLRVFNGPGIPDELNPLEKGPQYKGVTFTFLKPFIFKAL